MASKSTSTYQGLSYDDKPYRRYEITLWHISRLIGAEASVTVLQTTTSMIVGSHKVCGCQESNDVKRMRKLELLKEELQEPVFTGEEDCEVLLLAWGSMWGPVAEAVRL